MMLSLRVRFDSKNNSNNIRTEHGARWSIVKIGVKIGVKNGAKNGAKNGQEFLSGLCCCSW